MSIIEQLMQLFTLFTLLVLLPVSILLYFLAGTLREFDERLLEITALKNEKDKEERL